jgi:hypothetical protein
MSKERELLKKILNTGWLNHELSCEVEAILARPEQEPEAWITEWVQRYRHNDTPIIDRAVSFTKGDAPAVPNPNYIPLYTAPPKREPLSEDEMRAIWKEGYNQGFNDGKYLSSPKREPLSDDEMRAIWKEGVRGEIPFVEIGRAIEKAHGIGVDDEN